MQRNERGEKRKRGDNLSSVPNKKAKIVNTPSIGLKTYNNVKARKTVEPTFNRIRSFSERIGVLKTNNVGYLTVPSLSDLFGNACCFSLTPSNVLLPTFRNISKCYNRWRPAGPWKFEFERLVSEYSDDGKSGAMVASFNPVPGDAFTTDITAASELHHVRMLVSDKKHTLIIPKAKLSNGSWYNIRDTVANSDLRTTDAGFVQMGTYSCGTTGDSAIEVYFSGDIEFDCSINPSFINVNPNNAIVNRLVDNYHAVMSTTSGAIASGAPAIPLLNGNNGQVWRANLDSLQPVGDGFYSQDVRRATTGTEVGTAITMFDLLPGVYRVYYDIFVETNNGAGYFTTQTLKSSMNSNVNYVYYKNSTAGYISGDDCISGSFVLVVPVIGLDPATTSAFYLTLACSTSGATTWTIRGQTGGTASSRISVQRLC